MEAAQSQDELILRIAQARGTAVGDVRELVKKKQEEFSGLLTEKGAMQLLAQESGIESEPEKDDPSGVVALEAASDQCDVFVRVYNVFAPKAFEKNERKGRVCNVLVTDGKSKATLVLWNRDVDLVELGKIERNDFLLVKNVQVKNAEQLELQSSMLTRIIVKKQDDVSPELSALAAGIPRNFEAMQRKLSEIKEGDDGFDCYARVLRVDAEKEFVAKDGRKGRLASMLVSDGSASVRAVLWDKNADVASRSRVGDAEKIEGGDAKKAFSGTGIEINVGRKGRPVLNPYKPPLKDKEEILRGMYEEKPLSQAQECDEFVSSGTVLSIENAMTVKKCRTCNSTVGKESAACGKCQDRRFRELLVR